MKYMYELFFFFIHSQKLSREKVFCIQIPFLYHWSECEEKINLRIAYSDGEVEITQLLKL